MIFLISNYSGTMDIYILKVNLEGCTQFVQQISIYISVTVWYYKTLNDSYS